MNEAIYVYTLEDAVADGFMVSTDQIFPNFGKHFVSHITTNLLSSLGYYEDDETTPRKVNLVDLCNQAGVALRRVLQKNGEECFVETMIETPNGHKERVFIQLNEVGRWTVMLPEDY